MKSIKWLKMGYPGLDLGAVYSVEDEFAGFLQITDEFGRPTQVHCRYLDILFCYVDGDVS